jgi:hypothetical protein
VGTSIVNGWPSSSWASHPNIDRAAALANVIRPRASAVRIASREVDSVTARKRSSAARSSCSSSSVCVASRPHTYVSPSAGAAAAANAIRRDPPERVRTRTAVSKPSSPAPTSARPASSSSGCSRSRSAVPASSSGAQPSTRCHEAFAHAMRPPPSSAAITSCDSAASGAPAGRVLDMVAWKRCDITPGSTSAALR